MRTSGALNALGVQYAALDILPDPRIREELSGISGWPTIPQLFIDGELVGGCDIVLEMYETGRAGREARRGDAEDDDEGDRGDAGGQGPGPPGEPPGLMHRARVAAVSVILLATVARSPRRPIT